MEQNPATGFVGRLEVLEGLRGRRSCTPAFKARLVAQSYLGGESVSSLARRNGLSPQQLFDWRREARRGRLAPPEEVAEALGMRPIDDAATSDVQITVGAVTVALPGGASTRIYVATRPVDFRNYAERRIMWSPRRQEVVCRGFEGIFTPHNWTSGQSS